MSATETLDKTLLENALNWFHPQFRHKLVVPIEGHFPNFVLPTSIRTVIDSTARLLQKVSAWPGSAMPFEEVGKYLSSVQADDLRLFKQIVLLYRRDNAAYTETRTEKTFHLELTATLEKEVKSLDALVRTEWFSKIGSYRLPRLKDFLPVQLIESAATKPQPPRQFDQKFNILQAPALFLQDLAYLREKCEERDVPIVVAFLDIDGFKKFNTDYTEPRVDRNLLPIFLQTVEAHVYHHGYAYQEGGDEITILVPSLTRPLAIAFLEALRVKIASLEYPDIKEKTTVSIGVCIVDPNSSLTDRELRDRASDAKKFAKTHGKNCIATYKGSQFVAQELEVVKPNS